MASSWISASGSLDDILDEPTRDDDVPAMPERVTSRLRSRKTLRDICKRYRIPNDFAPVLAGDLSSCSPPPPGSVCVYVDALEAGMRLPLHPFYGEVFSHFGIAPGQLVPNTWRALVGFVVLSHFAGVAPSLAVFRHFFALCAVPPHNLYTIRGRDAAGLLFGRLNTKLRGWKGDFFFLSSAAPWPCPVQWGVPSRFATSEPALTDEEKGVAAQLLRVRGRSPIDLTTYLHERNLTAAKIIPRREPTPSPSLAVQVAMEDVRAEKTAVPASVLASSRKVAVKSEQDCIGQPCGASLGKRKKLAEDRTDGESSASDPPGFSATARPHRHRDSVDWKAARQLLQCTVTPLGEREIAASKPADVVASSYVSVLQAANDVAFSLGYALELEDKLRASEREAAALRARERDAAEEADALRAELRKAKAEVAETKAARGLSAWSREHARALAERELQGYERGMEDMKRAALHRYPNLDPELLVVPLHGPS
uniref:Uncharacterized protein n=1 Tax=Avena sativa TaxID=4498 RepID=A0ACD5YPF7_AVESA